MWIYFDKIKFQSSEVPEEIFQEVPEEIFQEVPEEIFQDEYYLSEEGQDEIPVHKTEASETVIYKFTKKNHHAIFDIFSISSIQNRTFCQGLL